MINTFNFKQKLKIVFASIRFIDLEFLSLWLCVSELISVESWFPSLQNDNILKTAETASWNDKKRTFSFIFLINIFHLIHFSHYQRWKYTFGRAKIILIPKKYLKIYFDMEICLLFHNLFNALMLKFWMVVFGATVFVKIC